jgi:hypothetical protein
MFDASHQSIFRSFVSDQKQKKISCPVCLHFTEKINFLLVNEGKFFTVKTGFEELKKK